MRKTKIICTLGPSISDEGILKELMLAGMNVARFNFSHQTHEEHKARYNQVDKLRTELGLPIATLLDTKGPEIRLGLIENDKVELVKGETITLTTEEMLGTKDRVSITYKNLPNDITIGNHILIDDGLIALRVLSHTKTDIVCEILNGGMISNRKGVNVPGVSLSMPYLSEQDRKDIEFGAETGFDFIAASFTRTAADIEAVKAVLSKYPNNNIKIVAKIENAEGVNNIDDILRVCDGVMVARGDMGVEIPLEEIPVLQKMLIKKAYNAGKQVITATQMLDSMMKNPRPTRAETTDVANAIYDGTSAIMLSGETAAGLYPIEAVKTMAMIAERTEQDIDYEKRFRIREVTDMPNVTNAISHATVTTAMDLNAAAIVTVTKTGQTARMISKFRPMSPIIGCSPDPKVVRQLNMSWGVIPLLVGEEHTTDELFEHAIRKAQEKGLVESGDLVVITAGIPLGISGTTNLMKVHIVGDILISGTGITEESVCGNLCVCSSEEQALKTFKNGDILVIPKTSNNIFNLIKNASGVITEQDGVDSHAAIAGLALNKPVLIGATNATQILRSGTTVHLDASNGIVCNAAKCNMK
ncbi:pyruvate kinase [Paludicola sp. MB14-C6]|uniref:pyruvate kinase n=1 Tax=Paludihabitans sp. MB14-C6 TaxID=3070656 RepID=UPI0027DE61B0|nr:pyruvate kinase [Paludicola sp. MB14-C6]WMJ24268.1 pyruvate kinase [Paludicola sp. MB14-C6]